MEFFTVPNPIFIPMEFAKNGIKNVIQKVRQSGQDAQDMTWNDGTPPITLTKLEDGGLPPKGQDYNGVLNAISSHTVFGQNGGRYKWDPQVVIEFGGYPKDAIVQSSDGTREYISLIDNNQINPDSSTTGTWSIYAGQGSVPLATSTTTGITKVLNILNSTDVGSALSAAMGRALSQAIDLKLNISNALGFGQSWQNMTGQRSLGGSYTNFTNRPIQIYISVRNTFNISSSEESNLIIDGVTIPFVGGGFNSAGAIKNASISVIIPPNSTYRVVSLTSGTLINWSELR